MKYKEFALANTFAVLTGIIYIVCDLWVILFPNTFKLVSQSWFHGINMSLVWTGGVRGNFFLGLVSAMVGTWLVGWLFAWLYNRFSK